MTTLRNKQYDPGYALRTALSFASEASSTLHRRMRGSPDRVWLQSSMYPDYYLNTFHYQVTRCHHALVSKLQMLSTTTANHHFLAYTACGCELVGVAWRSSAGLWSNMQELVSLVVCTTLP